VRAGTSPLKEMMFSFLCIAGSTPAVCHSVFVLIFNGLGIVAAAEPFRSECVGMERELRGTADSPTALVPEAPENMFSCFSQKQVVGANKI